MTADPRHYVTPEHLTRLAIKYVRQSTVRQVRQNTESAHRQYGLQTDLEALGWVRDNILTIDCDQGHSGASTAGRAGFQRLMSEVALARVGVVAALEVSRLSRDSADWAQLVKICALTGTLLMDEHGVYDPRDRNDRMMLGIKGHISENERMMIRDRNWGAILSRAKRGAFRCMLPIGFVYDAEGRVLLDPDQQVQQTIRHFFETFRRVGSAQATARAFREEGVKFPYCVHSGPRKNEIQWLELTFYRAIRTLHNPRYAGAYSYGRATARQRADGGYLRIPKPREQWISFLPNAHPGYISQEEFERNEALLRSNCPRQPHPSRGPAREGPALLQGLIVCGLCGRYMTINYQRPARGLVPIYLCEADHIECGRPVCQRINGEVVDAVVGDLLVEVVTPAAVAAAIEVQHELQAREEAVNRLRRQSVDRARYETDMAHRRYLLVDPENRLVASTLEKVWNEKLQALARAEADYEVAEASAKSELTQEQQTALQALPKDLAALWRDPRTPCREKKRMARLIIEDVTLVSSPSLPAMSVHVRLRGGVTRTLSVSRPLNQKERATSPEIARQIQQLASSHGDAQIAQVLNQRGLLTSTRRRFTLAAVRWIRAARGIPGRSRGRSRPRGRDGAFIATPIATGWPGVV